MHVCMYIHIFYKHVYVYMNTKQYVYKWIYLQIQCMCICIYVCICMYNTVSVCTYVVFIYFDLRTNKHLILYICMYVWWSAWDVAGYDMYCVYCMAGGRVVYTILLCKGRVPYLVSGMKIYPSVQEEDDCASMAIACSVVKSAPSPLQQGHTDRQTDAG